MKAMKIGLVLLVASILSSCVYHDNTRRGYDGRDGLAFLSIYPVDLYPTYIETDGALPQNFYWEDYYEVYPGFYSIYYEYAYDDGYRTWYDAYTLIIQITVNPGELGSYNYNGRDGADKYFNLDIEPDGYYDFYEAYYKSGMVADTTEIIKVMDIQKGELRLTATYKRATPKKLSKSTIKKE